MMIPYLLSGRMPPLRALRHASAGCSHPGRGTGALAAVALAAAGHGLALYWYWSRPDAPPLKQAVPLPSIDILLAAPSNRPITPSVAAPVPARREPQPRPDAVAVKKPKAKVRPKKPLLPENMPARPKPQDAPPTAPVNAPAATQEQVVPPPPPVTPATVQAGYLSHPDPEYPVIARARHWEGDVLLRVLVREDGAGEQVEVERSSGHDALDEAALNAVRNWRFVPAKRGELAVASWVTVPISFRLSP